MVHAAQQSAFKFRGARSATASQVHGVTQHRAAASPGCESRMVLHLPVRRCNRLPEDSRNLEAGLGGFAAPGKVKNV